MTRSKTRDYAFAVRQVVRDNELVRPI